MLKKLSGVSGLVDLRSCIPTRKQKRTPAKAPPPATAATPRQPQLRLRSDCLSDRDGVSSKPEDNPGKITPTRSHSSGLEDCCCRMVPSESRVLPGSDPLLLDRTR